jgi:hypothetical protein
MTGEQVQGLLNSTGLRIQDPGHPGHGVSIYYSTTSEGVYMIRCAPGEKNRVWFGRWRRNASERSMRNEWWNGDVPTGHCRMRRVEIVD